MASWTRPGLAARSARCCRTRAAGGDGGGLCAPGAAGRGARGGGRAAGGGGPVSVGERPWSGRRLHFVGVGGAGMSGYARAAHALGAHVSGSDGADGPFLRRLAEDGVLDAQVGHRAENVPAGEGVELVYSSAIAGGERGARGGARARCCRSTRGRSCWAS